jgi:hypothetical protein
MSKPYQQKFKGEWFKDEELKDWIKPINDKSFTASCKYCLCNLKGSKIILLRHAKSAKHIENVRLKKTNTRCLYPLLSNKNTCC